MPFILPASIVQEYVCDLVIFLFKVGESLLDATIRPYVVSAVCSDLYPEQNYHEYWYQDDHDHYRHITNTIHNATDDVCGRLSELPERLTYEGKLDSILKCDVICHFTQVGAIVQQHAAGVLVAHRVLVNVPAVILGLFCGAWSDIRGRKLPMMAPSAGSCLAVTLYLASTQAVNVKVPLLLAGAATQGIFGKTPVMTMAVNSHVSDTSDMEQRTRRLGRILASSFLGMFVGSLLAGLLQDLSSLLITLCVVSACHALCVITVLVVVTETVSEFADEERVILRSETIGVKAVAHDDEDEDVKEEKARKSHGLFSWQGIRDSGDDGGEDKRGKQAGGHCHCYTGADAQHLSQGGRPGRDGVIRAAAPIIMATVLFSKPNKNFVGHSRDVQMPDISIVMLGVACKLIRTVWAGFCTETWMVFTSVVSGALGGLLIPGLRSVLSKTVHESEVGKLFLHPSLYGNTGQAGRVERVHGRVCPHCSRHDGRCLPPGGGHLPDRVGPRAVAGTDAAEDGAYGLLLNFARPYFSLETGLSASGKESESEDQA
ncbi:hypothetical protein BaRGS_00039453 [Batillaria attramentaria]|uniref:Uncharacterized protein n=1 Tax=Batillaria attramentaria TaxID=370345 RepID=A0ABD0J3M3_9CAEN